MASSEVFGGASILAAKLNEVTVGTTAPTVPALGNLWLDTSVTPATPKAYNGSTWVACAVPTNLIALAGDTFYGTAANTVAKLSAGASDQIMRIAAGIPNWYTPINSAIPAVNSAAGAAGVSTLFSRNDHSHPDNILTGAGTGAGFNITLASIPGYVSAAKIVISISSAPTAGNVVMRVNSLATAIYVNNNVEEAGNIVSGVGLAGQASALINDLGAPQRHMIELTFFDDGSACMVVGNDVTINGLTHFSSYISATAITTLNFLWTGSSVWSYRAISL